MFNFEEMMRGYSDKQESEADIYTLINFLIFKGLIDGAEFTEYYDSNFQTMRDSIVERDRQEVEKKHKEAVKAIEKYEKEMEKRRKEEEKKKRKG